MAKDAHKAVLNCLIAAIEKTGLLPWKKTWRGKMRYNRNTKSNSVYRGINQFVTTMVGMANSYNSPYWLTYKQAQELGGTVKRGEKGTPIVYWCFKETLQENGEVKKSGFPICYTVFNLDQTDKVKLPKHVLEQVETDKAGNIEFSPIAEAETIVANMRNRPEIIHGGTVACYSPKRDKVCMPKPETFEKEEAYYSTLFHELGHATGHRDRLNRKEIVELDGFGSHNYSKEELVAEMTAAFLCGDCGIVQEVVENSAAYIKHWLKALEDHPKMLVEAASKAQKAADYILGEKEQEEETE